MISTLHAAVLLKVIDVMPTPMRADYAPYEVAVFRARSFELAGIDHGPPWSAAEARLIGRVQL
jgi:hypothetical protein